LRIRTIDACKSSRESSNGTRRSGRLRLRRHLLVIPSMLTTGASRFGGLMSAKMNWPRVRMENKARRFGSEWIGSDPVGATLGKEIKSSRHSKVVKGSQPSRRPGIAGCMCGKATGFTGLHRKKKRSAHLARAQNYSPPLPQVITRFSSASRRRGKLLQDGNFSRLYKL